MKHSIYRELGRRDEGNEGDTENKMRKFLSDLEKNDYQSGRRLNGRYSPEANGVPIRHLRIERQ